MGFSAFHLQMPSGVPVATVALNGARNAGILAAQILGTSDEKVAKKIEGLKKKLETKVAESVKVLNKKGWKSSS